MNATPPTPFAAVRARPKIRWFVWTGATGQPLERIPHTETMRGWWPGWDVECSCGAGSHTGGAIKADVERWREDHLWNDHGIATGLYKRLGYTDRKEER